MGKRTSRNAKLRFYDGTGTPYYLELDFDLEDFAGPIGIPRQEEELVLNRGTMDANAHYCKGADDKLMEPQEISASVLVRDDAQTRNIRDWLKAMNDGLTTQVNSNTLVSTQGDTQRDGANNNPTFADSNKGCSNVEYLVECGATDYGYKYAEVWLPLAEQQLAESPEGVKLTLKGYVYGTITSITAFTAGTDVEA